MEFDHIAVSGRTLQDAQAFVEEALGVSLQPGGDHAVFHTHNAVLGLEDGLYLEAIAINPAAPKPDRPRWFDLDRFDGPARLTNWICRTSDLLRILSGLPAGMGIPVSLQRDTLRWQMAVPDTGVLPFDNCAPALIQWDTATHPAAMLVPSGVRLRRLTVTHPDVQDLGDLLLPHLTDDRLRYTPGPAGLVAEFDTPHGARSLSG